MSTAETLNQQSPGSEMTSPKEPEIPGSRADADNPESDEVEETLDSLESYDYGSVEELYQEAEEEDLDGILESGNYDVVDEAETVILGKNTADEINEYLEGDSSGLIGSIKEKTSNYLGKAKEYGKALMPEDRWDWTMYGGTAIGIAGLLIGSTTLIVGGLAAEGAGLGGWLYSDSSKDEEDMGDDSGQLLEGKENYEIKLAEE